jgi:hypothetical protein
MVLYERKKRGNRRRRDCFMEPSTSEPIGLRCHMLHGSEKKVSESNHTQSGGMKF